MRTPKYVFNNVASARLRFDVAYKEFDNQYSDTLEVKLSTNCGLSWTSIYSKGGSVLSTSAGTLQANTYTPTAGEWRKDTIDVSALTAGQGNVMFSFVNHGHYGQALYLDNINLAFPTPTINFNAPGTICVGANLNLLNSSLGAASYTWTMTGGTPASSNSTNTSVSYTAPGVYNITLIGATGTTTASLTQTVNVINGPTIVVNTPTVCASSPATLTASGATTYTWSTGPFTSSIVASPSVTTVYTVTGNNGTCSSNKTATIIVTPNPTVGVSNQTICAGGTATLNATGATTYSWSTGFTGNPLTVSPGSNTTYTVIGTTTGCTNTKTVSVTIGASLSVLINTNPINKCATGSATLTASGATNYTWTPGGSNAVSIVVNQATTTNYTVVGTNGACSGFATTTVNVIPTPTFALATSPSQTICAGKTVTMTAS